MKTKNNILCIITVFMVLIGTQLFSLEKANAASLDYPKQEIELVSDNGSFFTSNGQNDNSAITVEKSYSKTSTQRWKLERTSENNYKIISSHNGKLLTPASFNVNNNSKCTAYSDAYKGEQVWCITGVDKDSQGIFLNYKITNSKNNNLALTLNGNGTLSLSYYSGANNQKFRLNSSGLEGFAGYGKDINGQIKASTIGGVLGETVTCDNLNSFKNYVKDNTPRTIIITNNITASGLTKIQIGKNKTIIGAYGTYINNLYFYLTNNSLSGNLVMKNLKICHDASINANNDIPLYISAGTDFWIDHCTFQGHDMNRDTDLHHNDVDKLMFVGFKADYVSVSNCKFLDHKYGLILGYPEDDDNAKATYTGFPRMTIYDNYFSNLYCRAPGLMRYGYFHCYNNYIDNCHLAYTACTNANIYSEKNYFNKVAGIVDDKGSAKFSDHGSYPKVTAPSSPQTYWNPFSNYTYNTMEYTSLDNYCKNYAGAQNSKDKFIFATYSAEKVPTGGSNTPTPTPTPSGKLKLDYTINNWGSGYQVNFKITNNSSNDVQTWTLKIKKSSLKIDTSYNINLKEDGDYYIITPLSWNSSITKGNSIEFGIQGSGSIGQTIDYSLS